MHYVTLWSLLTFGQTAFLKRQVAIWFSHTTVARGPGAWSRGEGMLQHLYVASQVGSLDARDRPSIRHPFDIGSTSIRHPHRKFDIPIDISIFRHSRRYFDLPIDLRLFWTTMEFYDYFGPLGQIYDYFGPLGQLLDLGPNLDH